MNRKTFLKTLAGCAIAGSTLCFGVAHADDRGTPAEAEAMVKRAVAHIKAVGADKAYADFTAGASGFKEKDLYVIVYTLGGKNLAHGANKRLVGQELIGMKDPDGKLLNQMLVDVAKTKGSGWSDTFKFRNPTTDKLQTRTVYVQRLDDTFVGTGVFKD